MRTNGSQANSTQRTDRRRRQGSSTRPIACSRTRPFNGMNFGQKMSWVFGSTSRPTASATHGNTSRRLGADVMEWPVAVTRDFCRPRNQPASLAGMNAWPAPAKPAEAGTLVLEMFGPATISRVHSRIAANLILTALYLPPQCQRLPALSKTETATRFVLLKAQGNGAWFASRRAQLRLCAYSLQR